MSEHLTNVTLAANDMAREIAQLKAELERAREDLAFLERATLPELRRTIEHHKDGKQRWRARAVKAEARVRELDRPAVEAKRAEIRQSYTELIAQAEQDRDFEGAFDVQCRLRDREEQWAREDAEADASADRLRAFLAPTTPDTTPEES